MKKIIFIVGHGHSGSSIVGRVLGSSTGTVNIGEVGQLDRYLKKNDKCYCGELISRCKFWFNIVKKINASLLRINAKHVFNIRKLKYRIDENKKLFKLILNHKDRYTAIDSNKNIVRAFILAFTMKNEYDVELIETHRGFKKIYKSYLKRGKVGDVGKLSKRPTLIYFTYTYFQFLSLIIRFFCYLKGIKYTIISELEKDILHSSKLEHINITLNRLSSNEYEIKEWLNHSIGGSRSSKKSNLLLNTNESN